MKVTRGAVSKRTWIYDGRKRSAWGYSFKIDGQQVRKQGYLSRAEAQEALDQARDAILHPVPAAPPVAPSMTFAGACHRYLREKARKKSLADDRRMLEHLKTAFGGQTSLSSITANVISEYRGRRLAMISRLGQPLSPAGINRPLSLLTLAHREWQVLEVVPPVRMEPEREGRVVWLEPDAERVLLEAARSARDPDLYPMVLLAIEGGLRKSEVLGLTWDRVDLSRGVITLSASGTKSKRRRVVHMRQAVYDLLAAMPSRQGPVLASRNWNSHRKPFEAIAELVATAPDGEPLSFHGLRHHFAS